MSASHTIAATIANHQDSRTRRANRGGSVAGGSMARTPPAAADRRGRRSSFLLKNIALPQTLHAAHYTPGGAPGEGCRQDRRRRVALRGGIPISIKLTD